MLSVIVASGVALLAACAGGSQNQKPLSANQTPLHFSTVKPSASVSPSGAASGKPDAKWELAWNDDFSSAASLKNWTYQIGGTGWGEKQLEYYDSNSAAVVPGTGLVITASKGGRGHQCWYGACEYSSARMRTLGLFDQRYGIFEASIKLPPGKGLWPAFWMMGSDINQVGWPADGEIDIMETNNVDPYMANGFLHAPGEIYRSQYRLSSSMSSGYHTYEVEWTPTGVSWFVDGHAFGYLKAYSGWPFDKPFFLILNLAVGGHWPGSPDSSTPFPAQMDVAWLHVYRLKS